MSERSSRLYCQDILEAGAELQLEAVERIKQKWGE